MCGIAGVIDLAGDVIPDLGSRLNVMDTLIAHRGPDGSGYWIDKQRSVGLVHRRLSIVDLTETGAQPMTGEDGCVLVFNGEIYNAPELRAELSRDWTFRGTSDTEVILAAHAVFGEEAVHHLRGMFSYAIWDPRNRTLTCARDRFGIKPFYYAEFGGRLYFASEAKALVPMLREIATDMEAISQYFVFQFCLGEKSFFEGIKQLKPAYLLRIANGNVMAARYWDVTYEIDWGHSERYFLKRVPELIHEAVSLHLRSDVPVGAYLSGGVDSSLITGLAGRSVDNIMAFHGKFTDYPGYDESRYAIAAAKKAGGSLKQVDISYRDFTDNFEKLVYHLDYPVAGPGSFPQFMVSKVAAIHRKVVLGGQGGDEIFGGYARYLIAYLEQCLSAAMDGTYKNGNYVVTIDSIIPNLPLLKNYKPMMQRFWQQGMFDSLDARYFRLVDRSSDLTDEVDWDCLDMPGVYESFKALFNRPNVGKEAYFDKMTHFDFKSLLPALLHVEDRVSMAHGLESRVPLLDHPLVEFSATIPADIKFKGGQQKRILKKAYANELPAEVLGRDDKMGFPVPLNEWMSSELKNYVGDIFSSQAVKERPYFNSEKIVRGLSDEKRFSRKTWGLLNIETWHRIFHDKSGTWKALVAKTKPIDES